MLMYNKFSLTTSYQGWNISYLKKEIKKVNIQSIYLVSLTLVLNSSYSLRSDTLKSQARSKGGKKEPFKKLLHKY